MDCKESSTIYCTPLPFQLQGTTDVLTSMSSLGFRIFGSKSPEFLVHLKDHFANRQPWVIFVVTIDTSPCFPSILIYTKLKMASDASCEFPHLLEPTEGRRFSESHLFCDHR